MNTIVPFKWQAIQIPITLMKKNDGNSMIHDYFVSTK